MSNQSDDSIKACYVTGEEIEFIANMFVPNEEQKEKLKSYVAERNSEELNQNPYKMAITDEQKRAIMSKHQQLMKLIKNYYSIENDEDLADVLINQKYIIFSTHSVERINERLGIDNVENDNPFAKLKELDLGDPSTDILEQEAVEVFVSANQIENNVSWKDDPFCVINYSIDGDKTVISVSNQYVQSKGMKKEAFIVVTVMRKDNKNL